jgi:hypothetical protein
VRGREREREGTCAEREDAHRRRWIELGVDDGLYDPSDRPVAAARDDAQRGRVLWEEVRIAV